MRYRARNTEPNVASPNAENAYHQAMIAVDLGSPGDLIREGPEQEELGQSQRQW
jgi:hypothetical protein